MTTRGLDIFEQHPVGQPPPVWEEAAGGPGGGASVVFSPSDAGPSCWVFLAKEEMVQQAAGTRCHERVEAWVKVGAAHLGQVGVGLHAGVGPAGAAAPVGGTLRPFGYWLCLGRAVAGDSDPVPTQTLDQVPLVLRCLDGAGGALHGRQAEPVDLLSAGRWYRLRLELLLLRSDSHLLRVWCGHDGGPVTHVRDVEVAPRDVARYRAGPRLRPGWIIGGRARGERAVAAVHEVRWEAAPATPG